MDFNGINPSGDLPPNHPLVLEALKGIISGPISELRTTVDNLIVNSSSALKKGGIDYTNILPQAGSSVVHNRDLTSQIANQVLDTIAPTQYNYIQGANHNDPPKQTKVSEFVQHKIEQNDNSDQMELPLFKAAQVDDLYKKLFDLESKIDIILKYVKNDKNKK